MSRREGWNQNRKPRYYIERDGANWVIRDRESGDQIIDKHAYRSNARSALHSSKFLNDGQRHKIAPFKMKKKYCIEKDQNDWVLLRSVKFQTNRGWHDFEVIGKYRTNRLARAARKNFYDMERTA